MGNLIGRKIGAGLSRSAFYSALVHRIHGALLNAGYDPGRLDEFSTSIRELENNNGASIAMYPLFTSFLIPVAKEGFLAFIEINPADIDDVTIHSVSFQRNNTTVDIEESGTFIISDDGRLIEAVEDQPRITYPPKGKTASNLRQRFIQFLPALSNLNSQGENFASGAWNTLTNTSILANQALSPRGIIDADRVEASTTDTSGLGMVRAFTVSTGETYSLVFVVEKDQVDIVQMFFGSGQVANNPRANFDVTNAQLGNVDSEITAQVEFLNDTYVAIISTVVVQDTTLQCYLNGVKTLEASRSETNSWQAGDGFNIFLGLVHTGVYQGIQSLIPGHLNGLDRQSDVFNPDIVSAGIYSGTSGAIFFNLIDARNLDGVFNAFGIRNATGNQSLILRSVGSAQNLSLEIRKDDDGVLERYELPENNGKIIGYFTSSEAYFFRNGEQVASATGLTAWDPLSMFGLTQSRSEVAIRDAAITANIPTNQQAKNLTLWSSFDQMAIDLNYTVE